MPHCWQMGIYNPITPTAPGDILLMTKQSFLTLNFEFKFLHFKWGRKEMIYQPWKSLENVHFLYFCYLC